eukprot:gene14711-16240_t
MKKIEFVDTDNEARFKATNRQERNKKRKGRPRTTSVSCDISASSSTSTSYNLDRKHFASASSTKAQAADVITFVKTQQIARENDGIKHIWEVPVANQNKHAGRPNVTCSDTSRPPSFSTVDSDRYPNLDVQQIESERVPIPASFSVMDTQITDYEDELFEQVDPADHDSLVIDETVTEHGYIPALGEHSVQQQEEKITKLYVMDLARLNMVTPLNTSHTVFAIPAFNSQKNTVHISKYFVITRRSLLLSQNCSGGQEVIWFYSCSCNPSREKFVKDLSIRLSCTRQELENLSGNCIHITASSKILADYDLYNGVCPSIELNESDNEMKFQVLALQNNNNIVCVLGNGGIGFVSVEMGRLKCCSCIYNVNSCVHIEVFRKVTDPFGDSSENIPDIAYELLGKEKEWNPSVAYQYKSLSTHCISFDISQDLARKISSGYRNFLKVKADHHILVDGSIQFVSKKCSVCSNVMEYDGVNDGLLNMEKFLVGYDVLRDYMYHFLLGNRSV